MQELDLLILGAGWTSTFLLPLLRARHCSYAATTRDGRTVAGHPTIPWTFNPNADDDPASHFSRLPLARNVLVTFPLHGHGPSKVVVEGYTAAHGARGRAVRFLQFGSSGIWQVPQEDLWITRHSPHNKNDTRAVAEDELLALGGCVLNLAGLWGGERNPKNWVDRVAKSKDDVRGKKSLHLIHGLDVARAVLALITTSTWAEHGKGQRWMLTDGFVYDWWSLMAGWADARNQDDTKPDRRPTEQAKWVYELMREENVRALPRSMEALGRCYDTREFWATFGLTPLKAGV